MIDPADIIVQAEVDRLIKERGPPKNDIDVMLIEKRLFNVTNEEVIAKVVDLVLPTVKKRDWKIVVGQVLKRWPKNLDPDTVKRVVHKKLHGE